MLIRPDDPSERRTRRTYLSLGSNIEPRAEHLGQAILRLRELLFDVQVSGIYETEPWGYADQARFLNMVAVGDCSLEPVDLLHQAKQIESGLGRMPTFRYGPRVIDIDILLMNDLQMKTPELVIPHPHLLERAFVLVPLAELAPGLPIPGTDWTAMQALAKTNRAGVVLWQKERDA
jgi:2-amino-4-hydroxy-6-hydroxymethyldihydropteridine diphosphokinase